MMKKYIAALLFALALLLATQPDGLASTDFEQLKKICEQVELAAVLQQGLPENSSSMNYVPAIKYYFSLKPSSVSPKYRYWLGSTDWERLELFLEENEEEYRKKYSESPDKWKTDIRPQLLLLTDLLNTLEETEYDYSWFTTFQEFAAAVVQAYKQANALHKMGIDKNNPEMLRLAILKLRLIEGYKDADEIRLKIEEEFSSFSEKLKTEEAATQLTAEMEKAALDERIAAEKEREEAVRAERLKLIEAEAETERAKAAAERAETLASELTAIREEQNPEIEKLKAEQEEARKAQDESQTLIDEANEKKRQEREAEIQKVRSSEQPLLLIEDIDMALEVFAPTYGEGRENKTFKNAWAELMSLDNLNDTKNKYIYFYNSHAQQPLGPGASIFWMAEGIDDVKVLARVVNPKFRNFAFQQGKLYTFHAKSLGVTTYQGLLGNSIQALAVEILYIDQKK